VTTVNGGAGRPDSPRGNGKKVQREKGTGFIFFFPQEKVPGLFSSSENKPGTFSNPFKK
jgi:hypothetical protein